MNCENAKNFGIKTAIAEIAFGGSSVLTSQITKWLGFSVVSIGALPALAFGASVGLISSVSSTILKNFKIFKNPWVNLFTSTGIGFGATVGLSYGVAALGFAASPIAIPTALMLTVAGIAASILIAVIIDVADKFIGSKKKAEQKQNNTQTNNNTQNNEKKPVEENKGVVNTEKKDNEVQNEKNKPQDSKKPVDTSSSSASTLDSKPSAEKSSKSTPSTPSSKPVEVVLLETESSSDEDIEEEIVAS